MSTEKETWAFGDRALGTGARYSVEKVLADIDFAVFLFRPRIVVGASLGEKPTRRNRVVFAFLDAAAHLCQAPYPLGAKRRGIPRIAAITGGAW